MTRLQIKAAVLIAIAALSTATQLTTNLDPAANAAATLTLGAYWLTRRTP